jgi:hypothetical protein
VPADRPPRGPHLRRTRRPDPLDERRGRLERIWGLVLRRFREAAEDGPAKYTDEERDDQT